MSSLPIALLLAPSAMSYVPLFYGWHTLARSVGGMPIADAYSFRVTVSLCCLQCPWLVTLFNAFYEEATISMVLEFMNGGAPCSSPDAEAAPLPLIRKE